MANDKKEGQGQAAGAEDLNGFKGEIPGPILANGPIEKRVCRDVLCCLVFIAFFCGFFGVTIWGLANGHPQTIGRGYDSDGNLCGYDDGYTDYKYLYFAIPDSDYLTSTLCVKTCPTNGATLDCKTNTGHTDCTADYTASSMSAFTTALASVSDPNLIFLYDTDSYLSRYCLPSSKYTQAVFATVTDQVMGSDTLENWISDLRTTWAVIAGMTGAAFLLGFVYMIFLRFCIGVFTWLAIVGVIVILAALGAIYYTGANSTSALLDKYKSGTISTSVQSSTDSQKYLAYVCWGVAGLLFLATCCLYSRIQLAIAILKAAADFVKSTPSIFIVPPLFFAFLLLFYAYSGITAVYLFSSGTPAQASGYPFGSYTYTTKQKYMVLYTIFGILWGNAFINAACSFVIASAVCLWYFAQPDESPHASIRRSLKRLFRYHLGSIAFGSFILAVIQFIRLVLAYIQKQVEANKASENKCLKMVLKCAQCYMACFERCIKFLNKNAYIQIALTGKSFCGAAKDAFFLILRNPIRFGVTSSIGGIFVFFGKFLIASAATIGGYIIISKSDNYTDVSSPLIPSIAIFLCAWGVAAVFLSVYGMAADTILACFVVEEELRAKNASLPLHCPKSLEDFVGKHKKK